LFAIGAGVGLLSVIMSNSDLARWVINAFFLEVIVLYKGAYQSSYREWVFSLQ
jgi:hypothetical protein